MKKPKEKITVICFYWQGDRWRGKDFDDRGKVNFLQHHLDRIGFVESDLASQYINNLYCGVKNNTTFDFDFICFTNEKDLNLLPFIETRPFIPPSLHGVLPRLYMFSEAAGLFGKRVFCFDIDIVIVGNLDEIFSYNGNFCTRAKFKPGFESVVDGDFFGFYGCKENEEIFYDSFIKDVDGAIKITQGRERYWIIHATSGNRKYVDLWQKLYPGQVVSYKRHARGGPPANARLVSFHGKPRPHQALSNEPWLKKFWKGA